MPGYHDSIKHRHHLSSFSLDAIEDYFAHLNPIAKRIAYDINDTKANYGQLWDTLDYHEQNDIINDTLIKPEISLRYFDNFLTPTPTNSSGNSYQSSMDSLTAIVLKDVDASRNTEVDREEGSKKNITSLKPYGVKLNSQGIKNVYSYDGRNLHTFGMQKVSLKVIRDDTLGCFRDEHSRPFCYRTKSQINLFILQPTSESVAVQKSIAPNKISTVLKSYDDCSPQSEESKKALDNYHRLQRQLKINLNDKKSQDTSIKPSAITGNRKIQSINTSYALENKVETTSVNSNNLKNAKSTLIQSYINSTQIDNASKIDVNYVIYSDDFNSTEESSNLLNHCAQSDLATASCSSAATSDDDEKGLEDEDAHLLDNDLNIRKGFDFLNNW